MTYNEPDPAVVIRQNTRERPLADPPRKPDGQLYQMEMVYDFGNSIAYSDDPAALLALLIEGYADAAPPTETTNEEFRLRYRLAKSVEVRRQALILVEYAAELEQCTPEERAILRQNRSSPIENLPTWSAPVPLVITATEYAPVTNLPHPHGVPRDGSPPGSNLVEIDPIDEVTFLLTLHDAGEISLGIVPAAAPPPTDLLAPFHLLREQDQSGLRVTRDKAELWVQGECIASAQHAAQSPWDFWYRLLFVDLFPQVTHWWMGSFWTGHVRLCKYDEAEWREPTADHLTGGMQFISADEPWQTWSATRADGQSPWIITTPLPPFEQESNLILRLRLAQIAWLYLVGEDSRNDWRVESALLPAATIRSALRPEPDFEWYLPDLVDVSRREAVCRVLGLRSPHEQAKG